MCGMIDEQVKEIFAKFVKAVHVIQLDETNANIIGKM